VGSRALLAKRRPDVIILLDILAALLDGPKIPTRLAQTANLSYDNLVRFATILESNKLVERKPAEGHELYFITLEGLRLHEEFRKNLLRLGAGQL
jgi:predicted transcriptional regulator